jgi:de-etiolated-1
LSALKKPPSLLRKFSPDGHHFIAFSSDQTFFEIYEYCGSSTDADLVDGCPGEYNGNESDKKSDYIRSKLFERFFNLKYVVIVAQSGDQLNRECSCFTEDGRCGIVGSAVYVPEDL